ncbi:unnamed protein product [Adineta steineri]|uniref:Uncharacterized protein n=1 Tax=Adineta steineri TaxID=433720 RepID=A0A819PNQ1_9BILA|nr:unnamed protein product [Adineta steineri]
MKINTFDPSLSSRYDPNSTRFKNEINQYYSEYQPSQCTYSYKLKKGIIYIITKIIALFGGFVRKISQFYTKNNTTKSTENKSNSFKCSTKHVFKSDRVIIVGHSAGGQLGRYITDRF